MVLVAGYLPLARNLRTVSDLTVLLFEDCLSDEDFPVLLNLELLGGQRVSTVAVSYEFEVFAGEFLEPIKSHTHGEDTGADIPVSGYLIVKDGA